MTWDADEGGSAVRGERWPMFHPSEVDPDSGYREHPYTIRLTIEGTPAALYKLVVHYLTIAPRLAYLEVSVNGVAGVAYLRPEPSKSDRIVLMSGLHTTIYADGVTELLLPGSLLSKGSNELKLVARDGGETIAVDRIEAIRRLDRMANGARLLYKQLALYEADAADGADALAAVEAVSTVVYRRAADGSLRNQCRLYVEPGGGSAGGELTLTLSEGGRRRSLYRFRLRRSGM